MISASGKRNIVFPDLGYEARNTSLLSSPRWRIQTNGARSRVRETRARNSIRAPSRPLLQEQLQPAEYYSLVPEAFEISACGIQRAARLEPLRSRTL